MKNEGFEPYVWVITPKNEGNVGSHDRGPLCIGSVVMSIQLPNKTGLETQGAELEGYQ